MMTFASFIAALWFSVEIILPIVGLIATGWWLKKRGDMSDALVAGINQLVFRYTLPALLFFSVVKSEMSISAQWRLIAVGYIATLLLYVGADKVGRRYIREIADHAVFVQGVFRGNLAIVGLVIVASIYGADGLAVGAVVVGTVVLLLNLLAVICLSEIDKSSDYSWRLVIMTLVKNPLVTATALGIVVKFIGLPVPSVVTRFGDYFVSMTLPLTLLCIGATVNLRGVLGVGQMALWASVGRVIVSPLLFLLLALVFQLEGQALGIIYIMGAVPAATAGYIMAKAMGGNDVAAANIIAITTFVSPLLLTPAIVIFRMMGVM